MTKENAALIQILKAERKSQEHSKRENVKLSYVNNLHFIQICFSTKVKYLSSGEALLRHNDSS